jgi:prepilin-type N-terminal cleavage/methylation domain-containing protein
MRRQGYAGAAGFSLIELMIAMAVTLTMMTLASKVLMECFNIRTHQDARSDTIADVQRSLNIISREVSSAGYGLTTNGIVGCSGAAATTCDSNASSIRVRSNLNRFDSMPTDADTLDDGEDVKYFLNDSANTRYLVRYNANSPGTKATVLANRITAMQFHYFDQRVTYTTLSYDPSAPNASLITNARNSAGAAQAEVAPNLARYVVIMIVVRLPAVGKTDSPGYQPASNEMLVSDVALRNFDLNNY